MSASAVMMVHNEEELLPGCLAFLDSMKNVDEVVVVDTESTDRTAKILDRYGQRTKKSSFVYKKMPFESFGKTRNVGLDLASKDWILIIDADETYTPQLDQLISDVHFKPNINAVRIPTLTLYKDRRHYLHGARMDPHVRLWRRGFAKFHGDIHENQLDVHGRMLYDCVDSDILTTYDVPEYHDVGMKHLQLLKSDAALVGKGMRWQVINALKQSSDSGIVLDTNTWLEWKHWAFKNYLVADLPERYLLCESA